MKALTTIRIRKDTRDELKNMGRKGQTYDELIIKLLRIAKKDMFFNELNKIADSEEFVSLDEI
jgi:hypothetical protein